MPFCARCIKAGRLCEGYERYPVFLNRTAQGADRRHRLDEVKPNFEILAALANLNDNRMLSQLSATPAFDSQIIALFFESYLPADKHVQDGYGRGWLQQAIGLQNPGEALHLSIKAMSMNRLGRSFKDGRLVFQGAQCYGSALQQLRKALQSKVTVWHDETLAAGFVLALYDVSLSKTYSSSFAYRVIQANP